MPKYKDVSMTAFIVNESRARFESLSRDIYAKLWVTEKTKQLWEELEREVYPYDHINLSLRNRFFFDKIETFVSKQNDSVFVNMAAGFTSYPYLLNMACRCIETDYSHIMNFKEEKIKQWQKEGTIPKQSVEFYPLDIESPKELKNFERDLTSWCANKPTIITMEGLTYYLSTKTLDTLFSFYEKHLIKGSLVIFDFWGPDSENYPVIQRVKKYFSRISGNTIKPFTYMNISSIRNIKGFSISEHTSIAELELRYTNNRLLQDKANRFPTEFIVLKKS